MKAVTQILKWIGNILLVLSVMLLQGNLQAAETVTRKAPAGIMESLAGGAAQELIVLFNSDAIEIEASARRAQAGVAHDNKAILTFKHARYNEIKQGVLSTLPSGEFTTLRNYGHLPMAFIQFRTPAALRRLLAHADVKAVYTNEKMYPHLAESLALIERSATPAKYAGSNTTVVVIDTGVDYTRAAFGACISPGVPASCKVSVAQDIAVDDGRLDDSGHGTNVAGIVLGVATDTRIAALDIFDGASSSAALVIDGINWAIANQATYNITAINMSLGSGGQNTTPCDNRGTNPFLIPIANARTAGIITVVSSGNDQYIDGISSPACTPGVVSVGAVYDTNVGSITWSVCTDSTTAADKVACFSNSAYYLTVLAPGALITSAGSTMGGTSQAAPHIAGAIAVLRSAFPVASLDQIVFQITNSGVSVTDPRNNITTPRLDLLAAIGPIDDEIPTLSEWGLIVMAVLLLFSLLMAEKTRNRYVNRQA